jgi:hypothetical protein
MIFPNLCLPYSWDYKSHHTQPLNLHFLKIYIIPNPLEFQDGFYNLYLSLSITFLLFFGSLHAYPIPRVQRLAIFIFLYLPLKRATEGVSGQEEFYHGVRQLRNPLLFQNSPPTFFACSCLSASVPGQTL